MCTFGSTSFSPQNFVVPELEESQDDMQSRAGAGGVSVSCGGTFSTLLIGDSGQLISWGLGLHGELGGGHTSSKDIR